MTDGGVSEAWMKDMTAKGEALNDSMLSQQLTWWCLDLAVWHHMPSRVQGQSGFEAAVNPCRHWTGDGKTGKADCANGWTARGARLLGLSTTTLAAARASRR